MAKLGQHFLKNKSKIKKIVEALELKNGDTVIEIGPGHGELTEEIIKRLEDLKIKRFKIIAIEKDNQLAENLRLKFKNNKNIEIIKGDALKLLPQLTYDLRLATNNYKIVGNIPYYITGYLLRILGELKNPVVGQARYGAGKPSLIILTIQKEVAERICLPRRSINGDGRSKTKMNLLAASVQFWAETKIISYVSKKYFRPQPKVDSAIIKLITNNQQSTIEEAINYYWFIKILFKQPRKTIFNNLRPIMNDTQLTKENLKSIGFDIQSRPQDLSLEQIINLSIFFKDKPACEQLSCGKRRNV